jgi:predicted DCC family thiol-disulfide oxidoreductase YuxK
MTAPATTPPDDSAWAMGPVLFFDGVCNFCEGSVQFVLRHERASTLRFASLQSDFAARVLPPLGVDPGALSTIVLVQDGVAHTKSRAVALAARHLRPPWSFGVVVGWLPACLANLGYDLFARLRYRLFGKKDACTIPAPAQRARFLDA